MLRLAPEARAQFSSGRIYSLVSSDVDAVNNLCSGAFGLLSLPIRIAVAIYFLYL